MTQRYYIKRDGIYFKPNLKGFTSAKFNAGVFTEGEKDDLLAQSDELTAVPVYSEEDLKSKGIHVDQPPMTDQNEWNEYAKKYGVKSGAAYKVLFDKHFHSDGDDNGQALVTMDDAVLAVKVAEESERHDKSLSRIENLEKLIYNAYLNIEQYGSVCNDTWADMKAISDKFD